MAKKAKVGDGPTNISAAKETIRDAVPKIVNLKERRKAINADIAELRERVNAAGVPKKALDHAIRLREMDPDDRQRYDEGYIIAREAIGVAVQRSLFEMIETPAGEGAGDEPAAKPNGKTKGKDAAMADAKAHLGTAPAPDAVTA